MWAFWAIILHRKQLFAILAAAYGGVANEIRLAINLYKCSSFGRRGKYLGVFTDPFAHVDNLFDF